MLESTIEKKVTAYAKKLGWLPYKFTSPANRGVCDHLYIRNGEVIFIEFKQLGKVPSPLQAKVHKTMREHGAKVYVIDSVEAGYDLFNSL